MTAAIYQSTKFDYARDQYFAVAGGHTLLRLTLGSLGGRPGGAIKTATASDTGAPPVYPDSDALIDAMQIGIRGLVGSEVKLCVDRDGKWRRFAEITLPGTRDQFIEVLPLLADEMARHLDQRTENDRTTRCNDLRDLYDDLSISEGEAIYLSDGVSLGSDGQLFE